MAKENATISGTFQTPADPNSRKSAEKALLRFLMTQFPHAFFEKEKYPLKIGIAGDILNWFDAHPNYPVVNTTLLNSVLGTYTSSPKYVLSLQTDTTRLDLTGQPAGKVTTEEAEQAKNKLEALHQVLRARHLKKKLTAEAETIKRAEASRQQAEKAAKKKTPQVKPNPKPDLSVSFAHASPQPQSEKRSPIIRFIRKKFGTPTDQK